MAAVFLFTVANRYRFSSTGGRGHFALLQLSLSSVF